MSTITLTEEQIKEIILKETKMLLQEQEGELGAFNKAYEGFQTWARNNDLSIDFIATILALLLRMAGSAKVRRVDDAIFAFLAFKDFSIRNWLGFTLNLMSTMGGLSVGVKAIVQLAKRSPKAVIQNPVAAKNLAVALYAAREEAVNLAGKYGATHAEFVTKMRRMKRAHDRYRAGERGARVQKYTGEELRLIENFKKAEDFIRDIPGIGEPGKLLDDLVKECYNLSVLTKPMYDKALKNLPAALGLIADTILASAVADTKIDDPLRQDAVDVFGKKSPQVIAFFQKYPVLSIVTLNNALGVVYQTGGKELIKLYRYVRALTKGGPTFAGPEIEKLRMNAKAQGRALPEYSIASYRIISGAKDVRDIKEYLTYQEIAASYGLDYYLESGGYAFSNALGHKSDEDVQRYLDAGAKRGYHVPPGQTKLFYPIKQGEDE